jgi:hypothetical protein
MLKMVKLFSDQPMLNQPSPVSTNHPEYINGVPHFHRNPLKIYIQQYLFLELLSYHQRFAYRYRSVTGYPDNPREIGLLAKKNSNFFLKNEHFEF